MRLCDLLKSNMRDDGVTAAISAAVAIIENIK